jgi:hypothetical protein
MSLAIVLLSDDRGKLSVYLKPTPPFGDYEVVKRRPSIPWKA